MRNARILSIGLVAAVAFAWNAAAVENADEVAGYCQSLERGAKGAGRHIYIRPAVFDRHVPALDKTSFLETFAECGYEVGPIGKRSAVEKSNHRHRRLLRPRRERPRRRRAAEQRDELAPPHSRTSLARATNTSDKETPSDAAVFRLMAM
jgi:hypothetical protein